MKTTKVWFMCFRPRWLWRVSMWSLACEHVWRTFRIWGKPWRMFSVQRTSRPLFQPSALKPIGTISLQLSLNISVCLLVKMLRVHPLSVWCYVWISALKYSQIKCKLFGEGFFCKSSSDFFLVPSRRIWPKLYKIWNMLKTKKYWWAPHGRPLWWETTPLLRWVSETVPSYFPVNEPLIKDYPSFGTNSTQLLGWP